MIRKNLIILFLVLATSIYFLGIGLAISHVPNNKIFKSVGFYMCMTGIFLGTVELLMSLFTRRK